MEIPESFIYKLLHGTLNDLGLTKVANKLVEEVNDKGLYIDANENSSKKSKAVEWFNSCIINGEYPEVFHYLEENLKVYSTGGDLTQPIGNFPNLYEILNVAEDVSLQDLIAIVLTIMYLVKRIEFLEKLITYSHRNFNESPKDGEISENNTSLIKFLSDDLGPILDSIPTNSSSNKLFDEETCDHLNRELESSKLLSLVMESPLNDFQIENLVFGKDILFYNVVLSNNTTDYLLNKLRQILIKNYFGKLFSTEVYQGSLPYSNLKLPNNFLNKIIEHSILYNRFKCPYYLPSRSIGKDEEFIPPIESNLDSFYKPRFPKTLLHTLSHHEGQVWFTKFSPSGKFLITGAADGKLIIYDVLNGFEVCAILVSDNATDKDCFVNSSYKATDASKSVIYCCWDPNEEYLVSGSLDTIVRVWDIRGLKKSKKSNKRITRSNENDEPKLLTCFVLGDKIRAWSCEFLPRNSSGSAPQFIIGSPDKVLKAYDIYGTELFDFYGNTHLDKLDDDVAMGDEDDVSIEYIDEENDGENGSNRLSANTSNVNLRAASISKEDEDSHGSKFNSFSRINDLSITPDGKVLITANNDKQVVFYSIPNLTNIDSIAKKISSINLNGRLTSCSVSQNQKYLLLSLAPDELQIWDIEHILDTGKPILYKKLIGHNQSSYIIRSCFGYLDLSTNQEELVLSGSDDGYIYLWNLFTGRLVTRVGGHSGICNSVNWNTSFIPVSGSKDYGKIWCSVGDDKLVKIWGPSEFL